MSEHSGPTPETVEPPLELEYRVIAAQDYIDTYNLLHHASPDQQLQPRVDIVALLHSFAGDYMPNDIDNIALMADLFDRLNNDIVSPNVKRTLYRHNFANSQRAHSYEKADEYLLGNAADFAAINDYISSHLNRKNGAALGQDDLYDALNNLSYENEIPASIWLGEAVPPNLRTLANLAENVNLEAILTKAAHAYIKLDSKDVSDTEKFRLIASIESTYAPILELTGFDAFAATLIDRANCVRLQKGGRQDLLDRADELLVTIGDRHAVEDYITHLPKQIFDLSYMKRLRNVTHADSAFFAFGDSHNDGDEDERRIAARLKTTGSIARKWQLQENEEPIHDKNPADIIGYTIICPDNAGVAETFCHVVEKLRNLDGFALNNAMSRKEPFHAKGGADFIGDVVMNVMKTLRLKDYDIDVKVKIDPGGFEVIKLTCILPLDPGEPREHLLPIEIQVLHEAARKEGRTGVDSHVLYKLSKYGGIHGRPRGTDEHALMEENRQFLSSPESVECLHRISDRKKHLSRDNRTINSRSRARAQELFRQIHHSDTPRQLAKRAL